MNIDTKLNLSFTKKLTLFFIISLSISTLVLSLAAYSIAQKALNQKGEQILRNSVHQAISFIDSEYNNSKAGVVDEQKAQEEIKRVLLGPMNLDGTRRLHHNIDLGEHGYFIIYDSLGNEVAHPSMEGQNVWDVWDDSKGFELHSERRYLVREQIDAGMNGGGFVYYSWKLPDSNQIEKKISYCEYFKEWDWIVVATAYEIDFNRQADLLLGIVIMTMYLITAFVSIIVIDYVNNITGPINIIARGMEKVSRGCYRSITQYNSGDEVELLVNGYNHMIASLQTAITDIENKNAYISHIAFHDDLTGLPNRLGMKAFIDKRLERKRSPGYMVQFDILGLKIINSTLGYEQGDKLLKIIGSLFADKNEDNFYIARTSSNEFSLWMENTSEKVIKPELLSLKEAIKRHANHKGFGQIVDLHFSIASYPYQGSSFDELYEKTTLAMKLAKDKKDLSIIEYSEEMKTTLENELLMRKHLKKALDQKKIMAYYQEQVDYLTNEVVGVEALARWNSDELGVVSPGVFIPFINQLNLVNEFTEYMIEQVFSDYKKLTERYKKEISISINISPSFFMDKNFYYILKKAIDEFLIPPGKLTLEITEDIFISEYNTITKTIDDLHSLGIRIAIDDFGTGYSSLNYLTNMHFDEMKIDKSFIDKILDDPKAFELFKLLCDIADIYGYKIVAEGVETENQLEKIKCTPLRIIQGYLFSKPSSL